VSHRLSFFDRGARSCQGSRSSAVATLAIQSSVGLVADLSTVNTWERETPAKSASAVRATPFRFAAERTLRATSVRNSRGSTLRTLRAVRDYGIRYPGLIYARRGEAMGSVRGTTIVVSLFTLAGATAVFGREAAADPPPDCADIANPTHDGALKMQSLGDQLMRVAVDFQKRASLEGTASIMQSVASAVRVVRCSESKLSAKELAAARAFETRADAWAASAPQTEAAEATFRANVLFHLCTDTRWIANARACIAREKANPSGVVDLAKLHDCGDTIQQLQPVVDKLRPVYQATRHHAFTDWQSEAACTANGWGDTTAE